MKFLQKNSWLDFLKFNVYTTHTRKLTFFDNHLHAIFSMNLFKMIYL